jgi:RNA polymerase sigma-70 factor (ECF subfamily)
MTFHTTRWSVVRTAGTAPPAERRAALETLCQSYHAPVLAFVRKRSQDGAEAEDLAQAFFTRLLEKDELRRADPERGRFRSFLLAALQHFLANEAEQRRAVKRGGGNAPASLDGEAGVGLEPRTSDTPEREFERAWARAVLTRALERLAEEQRAAGKEALFRELAPRLGSDEERVPHAEIARAAGTSENASRVALHRLRRRLAELVRDEVRETVGPGEIEDEVHVLRAALE